MWLADMDGDGSMDVVSADHTAHRGVWHKNPGVGGPIMPWEQISLIFDNIPLPGDFAMIDIDGDGDLDFVGTSMTWGQGFIVEQVQPHTSIITTVTVPYVFTRNITKLVIALVRNLPATGPPDKTLASIENDAVDSGGIGAVDQVLGVGRDFILATKDTGLSSGDYYAMAVLYMEGGGMFAPVPSIDYMAVSEKLTVGKGQVRVTLELKLVSQ